MLAKSATLEETAAVLWASAEPVAFKVPSSEPPHPIGRAAAFAQLAMLAGKGRPSLGRSAASLCAEAAHTIAALAQSLGAAGGTAPVHRRLARGWSADDIGAEAIRCALSCLPIMNSTHRPSLPASQPRPGPRPPHACWLAWRH